MRDTQAASAEAWAMCVASTGMLSCEEMGCHLSPYARRSRRAEGVSVCEWLDRVVLHIYIYICGKTKAGE